MNSHRQHWNQQQQDLRQALTHLTDFPRAVTLFLSQHAMLHTNLAAQASLWSFEDEIWEGLSDRHARIIPPKGVHSIAWVIWHLARIEDITMSMLLAGVPQLLLEQDWYKHLSVPYCDTGNAMSQNEIINLSSTINLEALRQYRHAVGLRTQNFVSKLTPEQTKAKVDPSRLQNISNVGAVVPSASGLLDYWGGLTIARLLLMPPTRHNFIHINEAIRIKALLSRK